MSKKELGLKERLVRYLTNNHGWVSSGTLQKLTVQYTKHTPRSAVRRLQELAEDGILERQLRKNHTWYRLAQKPLASQQSQYPSQENLAHAQQLCNRFDANLPMDEVFA